MFRNNESIGHSKRPSNFWLRRNEGVLVNSANMRTLDNKSIEA
jgi:hypothetical protein